jgi:hypothetical protein
VGSSAHLLIFKPDGAGASRVLATFTLFSRGFSLLISLHMHLPHRGALLLGTKVGTQPSDVGAESRSTIHDRLKAERTIASNVSLTELIWGFLSSRLT